MTKPHLSEDLLALDGYATKAMAMKARKNPNAVNLAFGEPHFGPPPKTRSLLEASDLTWDAFLQTSKSYEQSRGLPELREAIAHYYQRRYGLSVDPETEVLITHGGVEAINLAALITTDPGQNILLTDPTYMLYQRALRTLGRRPVGLSRTPGGDEYPALKERYASDMRNARALLVNSPENPSGYVMSQADFEAVAGFAEQYDLWVIHDEVYDSMAFARPHMPARLMPALNDRALLINSFSKKYGVPGLRIGWLCGPPDAITLAAKLHDFMYLGVNQLAERFALRMITDVSADPWMDDTAKMLGARAERLKAVLSPEKGFVWPRDPMGAMFAFPSVADLPSKIQGVHKGAENGAGDIAAHFLLEQRELAVIPGHVYGPSGKDCIRMILCSDEQTFEKGLAILAAL